LNPSRLLIAGSGGDSGKTLVTLGLINAWRHEGINIIPFKKGPDYIDPAWLTLASDCKTHNLDTWMMGEAGVLRSFTEYSREDSINLIEANRGLHDSMDWKGTHSSAKLARLLDTPVIIVLPVTKVTRTAAAYVLGMRLLDEKVSIAGVILNRVGGRRHESVVRRAIEEETGLPVLGAVSRIKDDLLPGRHLGLITPQEYDRTEQSIRLAGRIVTDSVDTDRLLSIARNCKPMLHSPPDETEQEEFAGGLKIGYFGGSAFTFYYPENLKVLRSGGNDLVEIDPLEADSLPDIDALYIGGGFPETHAVQLAENRSFMQSVSDAAQRGLPVWAECGGLMFLSRSLAWKGRSYPMAGVLPVDVTVSDRPQGHGYEEVEVDLENPFIEVGTRIRGHEFHYSNIVTTKGVSTVFKTLRGIGIGDGRDGIILNNIIASYLHIHSSACTEWGRGIIKAAKRFNVSHK